MTLGAKPAPSKDIYICLNTSLSSDKMPRTIRRKKITSLERELMGEGYKRARQEEFTSLTNTYLKENPDNLRHQKLERINGNTNRLTVIADHKQGWFLGVEFKTGKGGKIAMLFPYQKVVNNLWGGLDKPIEVFKKGKVSDAELNFFVEKVNQSMSNHPQLHMLRTSEAGSRSSAMLR